MRKVQQTQAHWLRCIGIEPEEKLRSLCLLGLWVCRGREVLWLLLRHPMMGDGGRAAPLGGASSPSASSTREEVEPPMMLLVQEEAP